MRLAQRISIACRPDARHEHAPQNPDEHVAIQHESQPAEHFPFRDVFALLEQVPQSLSRSANPSSNAINPPHRETMPASMIRHSLTTHDVGPANNPKSPAAIAVARPRQSPRHLEAAGRTDCPHRLPPEMRPMSTAPICRNCQSV